MIAGTAYRFAQLALRALTPILGVGHGKVARGLRGRRDAHQRLAAWGRDARDPRRPTVWFHAPSVGEGLQARAVMEALLVRRPDAQLAFTYFSPSAEELAESMPAAVTDYLPWDLPSAVETVLDALQPTLVVFTKTEIWPAMVSAARTRGIPLAMAGGALPAASSRRRWPTRSFLRESWATLACVGVVSEADALGFSEIGVRPEALVVTGDPGVDSASERALSADPVAPYLRPFHADPRPTLVAGSIWPSDEARLLPAVARVRESVPTLRLIAVPHEPDEAYVRHLAGALGRQGMKAEILTEVERAGSAEGVDAVVVDRVGPLAHLYSVGTVAYVGGGFHRAGLHSLLEPAAAGLPVVFGPGHGDAPAALGLLAAGGGLSVTDEDQLARALQDWFLDADRLHYTGTRARGYIDGHLGAAERTAAHLQRLMEEHETERS